MKITTTIPFPASGKRFRLAGLLLPLMLLAACEQPVSPEAGKGVAGQTRKVFEQAQTDLPFSNRQDFADAERGLLAREERILVKAADGRVIWDTSQYDFLDDNPSTVHPSLLRQAQLNNHHGLYEVTEGVYQLRGYDLSNMTLIDSDHGWIVVDPLTSQETARAAIHFAREHLGQKPVVAIIFTHSHIDHFGGVLGVVDAEDIGPDGVRVYAPEGFMEEATSENVIAGIAMGRRAQFMYGKDLPRSAAWHVDSGLGKSPAFGTFGIVEPTDTIATTGTTLTIDGVRFVFQLVSGSEAPAELTFYLPEKKAFCGAEMVTHTLHNLYTLRGAKVRDGLLWSRYIDESRRLFPEAEVFFASHHWPVWGQAAIREFLIKQRDLYKYIHDQTVRLFNQGLTADEIADTIQLPDSLATYFANRGYYGTVKHNARAVYQYYLGWFDGNPATLDALPRVEVAERYVALMGGADPVMAAAQAAYQQGDYRWAAELLNHLVLADADHDEARNLLARVYTQLGYQAESAPWRDVYLTGAYELQNGPPEEGIDITAMKTVLAQTPVERFFDSMAVRLNGEKAAGKNTAIAIVFSDLGEGYRLYLENAVLHHEKYSRQPVDATLTLTHDFFVDMLIGKAGIKQLLLSDAVQVEGSMVKLAGFFALLDKPQATFNIVEP